MLVSRPQATIATTLPGARQRRRIRIQNRTVSAVLGNYNIEADTEEDECGELGYCLGRCPTMRILMASVESLRSARSVPTTLTSSTSTTAARHNLLRPLPQQLGAPCLRIRA